MRAMIVGAGIGGLTAAIALQKAGMETAVFERTGELREVGAWTSSASPTRSRGSALRRRQAGSYRGVGRRSPRCPLANKRRA